MTAIVFSAGPRDAMSCGTSRKTLEILREHGAEVEIRDYLNDPPPRAELARLYAAAGISPREGLRAKEALAEELGLNREGVSEDQILDAMMKHPILINRPLVETPQRCAPVSPARCGPGDS